MAFRLHFGRYWRGASEASRCKHAPSRAGSLGRYAAFCYDYS